jgi:hypothetical protein
VYARLTILYDYRTGDALCYQAWYEIPRWVYLVPIVGSWLGRICVLSTVKHGRNMEYYLITTTSAQGCLEPDQLVNLMMGVRVDPEFAKKSTRGYFVLFAPVRTLPRKVPTKANSAILLLLLILRCLHS